MTQSERVLKALRSYRGTCQTDWLAPNVCDGGKPITRLAARVNDLREAGHEVELIGRRNGRIVYRLVEVERNVGNTISPPVPVSPSVSLDPGQPQLFEQPVETAHWKSEAA